MIEDSMTIVACLLFICAIGLGTQIYYQYQEYQDCGYEEVPCYDKEGSEIQGLICEKNCNDYIGNCVILFVFIIFIIMIGSIAWIY